MGCSYIHLKIQNHLLSDTRRLPGKGDDYLRYLPHQVSRNQVLGTNTLGPQVSLAQVNLSQPGLPSVNLLPWS
jgi:hypothetical protein